MSETLKVVFDTQIYLRALANPNSACGRLFADWTAYYVLYRADAIEAEIIDVFTRPKIRAKFPQITEDGIISMKKILQKAERVDIKPEDVEPICRDPKDDIFLACAKVAGADYLVSEDKDLLVLDKHHASQIMGVAAFLNVLEGLKASPSERSGEVSTTVSDEKTDGY